LNIIPRFTIENDDPDLLWRFTAYINNVVRYARLEYIRTLKYRKLETTLESAPEDALSYDNPLPIGNEEFYFEEENLEKAFSKLKSLRQKILTLIFVEGLSAQETADKLDCSIEYVYLQKHRAIKALRDQLMDGGGSHVE
jgi:RNA polymerase sigma factor (sigma-70 family)